MAGNTTTRPTEERLVYTLKESVDAVSLLTHLCSQDDDIELFNRMGSFAMSDPTAEIAEPEEVQIPFNKKHLPAVLTLPNRGPPRYGVILTHGAGGDMDHAHLQGLTQVLARHGYLCLRFTCKALNISYRIRAFTTVLDYLRKEIAPTLQGCFVGGRSMGSRAAAGVALADTSGFVTGVICLSYPLHPPGQPDKLRTDIFRLRLPTLFISGTKDPMCPEGSFRSVSGSLGTTRVISECFPENMSAPWERQRRCTGWREETTASTFPVVQQTTSVRIYVQLSHRGATPSVTEQSGTPAARERREDVKGHPRQRRQERGARPGRGDSRLQKVLLKTAS
ncbi:testis-expressed protein 30-like isoform X1 [Branchiostoma floridae x Branchiostoma belcheri]